MPYQVAERGGKYRVVKDGKVQPAVDKGGFKSRQTALDAAMQANKQKNTLGSGLADQAQDEMSNRTNRIDQAIARATGN